MTENTRYKTPCGDCGKTVSSPKVIVNHKGETVEQPKPKLGSVLCVRCGNARLIAKTRKPERDEFGRIFE